MPDEPYCPLSARELQIMYLVTEGLSNKQIAERTGITPLTVKSHLARIFTRIDANGREHAVAIGFRQGWLQ